MNSEIKLHLLVHSSTCLKLYFQTWISMIPCALMRHLIVQRTDEYRAKSHAALRWKLNWMIQQSTANFLHDSWFYVIQSIHTFCDTCFDNLLTLFLDVSVKSPFFRILFTFVNGKYHSRAKRRQTCGYMSAEENFFFKIARRDDDCLSSGYHSRRLTRSDGLWSIVCCGKKKPSWFAFLFLFTQKWDGEKIGLRIRIFFVCMFEKICLFLISIVRYERAWIFKKRSQKVLHLIINRENTFYDFGSSWQQMKKTINLANAESLCKQKTDKNFLRKVRKCSRVATWWAFTSHIFATGEVNSNLESVRQSIGFYYH